MMRSLSVVLCLLSVCVDAYVRLPYATIPASSSRRQSAVSPSDMESYSSAVSWDWQQVADSVFEKDDRPIILFDGLCNLCNGGVNFALDHDPEGNFRFVSLQSKVGQSLLIRSGRRPDDISSIVVCTKNGQAFVESDAILKIAQGLNGPLPLVGHAGFVIPVVIRDALYQLISENRYRFGEAAYEQCRMDYDGEYDNRFVADP